MWVDEARDETEEIDVGREEMDVGRRVSRVGVGEEPWKERRCINEGGEADPPLLLLPRRGEVETRSSLYAAASE